MAGLILPLPRGARPDHLVSVQPLPPCALARPSRRRAAETHKLTSKETRAFVRELPHGPTPLRPPRLPAEIEERYRKKTLQRPNYADQITLELTGPLG